MDSRTDDPLIQQVVTSDGRGGDLLTRAEHQFTGFKKEYGKNYTTEEEEDYRFGVFMSNLRKARRNQIEDPTATYGVTMFSDLTPSEFHSQYLGSNRHIHLPNNLTKLAPILSTDNLPTTFDWRDAGAVTDIKDQVVILSYKQS
ncbi:hypothetical protein Dsin_003593 [Dipteronia sinensis]|uniref:Cathepsin propeptide inhibitor domain-containing protein n=1 Tax=Dipteronia sinensis TaxID=43782 RepID=A0AAE0EL32_9ROSI|nr:hypothetical protein Dsin_003593 [Dipteronia sinensis]